MDEGEVLSMKFVIDKVILWPKKSEQRFRTVDFKSDKIKSIVKLIDPAGNNFSKIKMEKGNSKLTVL